MKLNTKRSKLPLSKSNPAALLSVFGNEKLLPMWVADMDFEIAKPIQKALKKRITHSGFGYEYKPDSFFIAQKKWYQKKYQLNLQKEQIVYAPSITSSLAIIIEKYSKEKEGIIIQPPVFMEFKSVIRKLQRRIITNPLKLEGNNYKIDFKDLEKKAQLENNKIMILCNPHNPVGRVWKKEELDKIVSICKENNILLVSDEIHKDIILFDHQFTSLLHYTKKWHKIIVCTSEAKTFNLCSITDAMIIIPDDEIRNSITSILKKYNLGSTNALNRIALETAYKKGDKWLKELLKTIENNVKIIENTLLDSDIKLIKPEGTYLVWLDFRDCFPDTKEMFNYLTKHTKIAMNAGHWFGREGALFMRINIATSPKKVKKAIQKIVTVTKMYS